MFINFIVVLIALLNFFLVYFYGDSFINNISELKYHFLAVIIVLETILLLYSVRMIYEIPIKKIKYNIQKFLVGDFKGTKKEEIEISQNNDLNYIIKFFNQTLNTLKNIKQEFTRGREIKGEVEIGKELQEKMINKKLIEIPSLKIVAKSKPAREIGGDSYDIIKADDNYYIYVGDATGHGVGAGFIMVMVNALIEGLSKVYNNGAKVLSESNSILKTRVKSNLLMSVLMVRWNEKEKRLYMTGAGHEFLIIYKWKNKKCYNIKSGGVALGMVKDISKLIKEREIEFEENDIIVLYSDGITEAINQSKKDGKEKMFKENNLMKAIEEAPNIHGEEYKSARSVFNNITIALSKFMGYKHVQLDDITLVTIQYKPSLFKDNNDFPENIEKDFITEWNW